MIKIFKKIDIYIIFASLFIFLYSKILSFGYIDDDFKIAKLNYKEAINWILITEQFRPIFYFSFALVNEIFGQHAFYQHLFNFLLHLFNGFLALNVFSVWADKKKSLIIVSTWTILPWVAFPIVWISQRSDLLMSLFILLSLLFAQRSMYKTSLAFIPLASLSKVTCLFYPLLYFSRFYFGKNINIKIIAFFIFATFFFIGLYYVHSNHAPQEHLSDINLFFNFLNKLKNFLIAWLTILFPFPFFENFIILSFYAVIIIFLIFIIKSHFIYSKNANISLIISFLLSFPTAINSELRITYLQSLFFLGFVIISIDLKSLSNKIIRKYLLIIIYLFFIIFCYHANQKTINKFFSKEFIGDIKNYVAEPEDGYYLNSFYKESRLFYIKLKNIYYNSL